MNVYGTITGSLSGPIQISGRISGPAKLTASLSVPANTSAVYGGPYEFTPTSETQTADIDGRLATSDIVINPIPSNYGLITWDGSTITVS